MAEGLGGAKRHQDDAGEHVVRLLDDDSEFRFTEEEYKQLLERRLCPYLTLIPELRDDHTVVYEAVCKLVNLGGGMRRQYVLQYCVGNYDNCPLIRLLRGGER